MSNLACIGMAGDSERLLALLDELVSGAPVPARGRSTVWTDPGGAMLAFTLRGNDVECMTPFFAAPEPTVWSVRSSEASLDPECRYCSGADVDVLGPSGDLVTRTSVQLLEFAPYERWLAADRTWSLEVVAFAQALDVYPDEAAFAVDAALGPGSDLKLSPNAFMPVGMFSDGGPMSERATMIGAGRVASVERRRNVRTGAEFLHLVVETFPGALTVVAPVDAAAPAPAVGHIVKLRAWLVGRPTAPPPPPARKRFLGLI